MNKSRDKQRSALNESDPVDSSDEEKGVNYLLEKYYASKIEEQEKRLEEKLVQLKLLREESSKRLVAQQAHSPAQRRVDRAKDGEPDQKITNNHRELTSPRTHKRESSSGKKKKKGSKREKRRSPSPNKAEETNDKKQRKDDKETPPGSLRKTPRLSLEKAEPSPTSQRKTPRLSLEKPDPPAESLRKTPKISLEKPPPEDGVFQIDDVAERADEEEEDEEEKRQRLLEEEMLMEELRRCEEDIENCDRLLKQLNEKERREKSRGGPKRSVEELQKEKELVEAFLHHISEKEQQSSMIDSGGLTSRTPKDSQRRSPSSGGSSSSKEGDEDGFSSSSSSSSVDLKRKTRGRLGTIGKRTNVGLEVTAVADYASAEEGSQFAFLKGWKISIIDVDNKGNKYLGMITDNNALNKGETGWFPVDKVKVIPEVSITDSPEVEARRRSEDTGRESGGGGGEDGDLKRTGSMPMAASAGAVLNKKHFIRRKLSPNRTERELLEKMKRQEEREKEKERESEKRKEKEKEKEDARKRKPSKSKSVRSSPAIFEEAKGRGSASSSTIINSNRSRYIHNGNGNGNPETWLVGIDGSKEAFYALNCCMRFAKDGDSVFIVFVVKKGIWTKKGSSDTQEKTKRRLQEVLFLSDLLLIQAAEAAHKARDQMGKQVRIQSFHTKAHDENVGVKLARKAKRLRADWIVVGAGGGGGGGLKGDAGGGGGEHGVGGTPLYLVKHAVCPVLILRDPQAFEQGSTVFVNNNFVS